MRDTWFTSDTHFTHDTLIRFYADRGVYADGDEMSEAMIEKWNKLISPRDDVYHIGDFGGRDPAKDLKVARRLNGRLHFVPGNHDRKLLNMQGFRDQCSTIFPYSYAEISVNKQKIILCHFPIWEWNAMHRGSWHIHGHVHGKPTGVPGKILDVGVDGNGLVPYHFDEVIEHMERQPLRTHHGNVE